MAVSSSTIDVVVSALRYWLLGQQITIENADGAGGTIGTGRVVRADPDGYTLLIYHVGISTAATLYRKLPYDTKSAFAAIGLVTDAPMTIIGRPDLDMRYAEHRTIDPMSGAIVRSLHRSSRM